MLLYMMTFILILPLNGERKTSYRSPFSCFKCTHHDKPQEMKEAACMKKFDLSKYTQEECQSENGPGKCLKAYEKTEARTKKQIEDDERSVTIRKCVSQGELDYLKNIRNIDTSDGCHTIRSTKTKHKVYCFCSNNLCNNTIRNNSITIFILIFSLIIVSVFLFRK
ncbi:unnamed protein product [Rotaria sp. Silwood1]|nr:unnamed protein product [Rotaria sp. Silwood1]CAF1283310.1 unnamed protein product [Rotaria sp. Silwood1]CAF3503154.1 unnamed protein product [Rotaria sp. Silwood1]CAF4697088.1 unnamed protein product [Rotaria sp. Silwood1]